MGIRFYCPQGHKLNVKEFQAGRKGICPYCGAKIEIPMESTRKSSKQERAERRAAGQVASPSGSTVATAPGQAPAPGGPSIETPMSSVASAESQLVMPVSAPQADAGAADRPPSAAPGSAPTGVPLPDVGGTADSTDSPPADAAAQTSTPESPQAPADPLAEAGDAVWYVRPASGGQFGPAGADVMRSWIGEGRVSPDSLVWREGWKDWQEAADVFPQLKADGPPSPFGDIPPATVTSNSTGLAGTGSTGFARPRRRSNKTQAIVITVLVLAVIALAVVFLIVLTGNSDAAEAKGWLGQSAAVPQEWDGRPGSRSRQTLDRPRSPTPQVFDEPAESAKFWRIRLQPFALRPSPELHHPFAA